MQTACHHMNMQRNRPRPASSRCICLQGLQLAGTKKAINGCVPCVPEGYAIDLLQLFHTLIHDCLCQSQALNRLHSKAHVFKNLPN